MFQPITVDHTDFFQVVIKVTKILNFMTGGKDLKNIKLCNGEIGVKCFFVEQQLHMYSCSTVLLDVYSDMYVKDPVLFMTDSVVSVSLCSRVISCETVTDALNSWYSGL
jgi:hypothetical protein